MVYLQHHFVILMHLIITLLQTTAQKVRHIGSGCSLHKQWINTTATRSGVKFSYPISMTLYAQIITHNGSTPGATGLENNTAYDDWSTTQAAPVWIIAIGR